MKKVFVILFLFSTRLFSQDTIYMKGQVVFMDSINLQSPRHARSENCYSILIRNLDTTLCMQYLVARIKDFRKVKQFESYDFLIVRKKDTEFSELERKIKAIKPVTNSKILIDPPGFIYHADKMVIIDH
ncbi:MAG: hypothetical protein JST26_11770 [Bacteroidetes bacterium]|nr:hypothetical protein [Bacteroidota bacterium]